MFSDYLAQRSQTSRPGIDAKPWVIAHRGYSGAAPENTMAAVDAARAIGCDLIEVDLQMSADDTPIVLHDTTLNRTTDSSGTVAHMSDERISLADAGGQCGPGFAGQRVPKLTTLLADLSTGGGKLLLELKGEWSAGAVSRVGTAIAHAGMADRTIIQSFNVRSVEVCRDVLPHIARGLLRMVPKEDDLSLAQTLDVMALNPSIRGFHLRRDLVEEVLASDLAVFVYTTDDPSDWEKLLSAGASGIITNHPGRLQGYLAAKYDALS